MKYEANIKNHGNMQALYAGYICYFGRFFLIALVSQYLLDFYYSGNYMPELWVPSTYIRPTSQALNMYEPFTLAYHKGYVDGTVTEGSEETAGLTRDLKPMKLV